MGTLTKKRTIIKTTNISNLMLLLAVIAFLCCDMIYAQPIASAPACADCGRRIKSAYDHATNCPFYPKSGNSSSGSSSGSSLSFEQGIMLNIFSSILNNAIKNKKASEELRSHEEKQKLVQQQLDENLRQKELVFLLSKQRKYNDSVAQSNHDRMMKEYKQLDGNTNLSYKGLDDDKQNPPKIQFSCKITSFQGEVVVVKSNGKKIILSETQSADIAPGDWIGTRENSRIKLHYAFESGGEDMILGSKSIITIGVNENGMQEPKLMKGDLYVVNNVVSEKIAEKVIDTKDELIEDVKQLREHFKAKFVCRTPSAVIGIRGTEFTLNVDEFDNTEVNVKNGIVDLTGNATNKILTLTTGTKSIVKATGEILGPLPIDMKKLDNWNQN